MRTFYSIITQKLNNHLFSSSITPTLKQTQSENGSVTITSPHDIVVSNQPQMPTPSPDSSAIKIKVRESLIRCYELIAIH